MWKRKRWTAEVTCHCSPIKTVHLHHGSICLISLTSVCICMACRLSLNNPCIMITNIQWPLGDSVQLSYNYPNNNMQFQCLTHACLCIMVTITTITVIHDDDDDINRTITIISIVITVLQCLLLDGFHQHFDQSTTL